jgi:hypothetical protein
LKFYRCWSGKLVVGPDNVQKIELIGSIHGHPLLTGDAAQAAHPTLVPIVAITRHCEKKCCSREGLPLVCGKADTAHSTQGISVGRGEAFRRMLFMWTARAEQYWPGIFYVGVSRPKVEGLFWGPCARPTAKWPV